MTEVLLKELSNHDIDWIVATGRREEIPAGGVLIQPGQLGDRVYLLLDGTLTIGLPQAESDRLALAFAALEGGQPAEREIARLSSGELVGEACFLDTRPAATQVKALEPSLVLSIPQRQLATKLRQDASFAAHFYRACSMLLSDRRRDLLNQFSDSRFAQGSQLREVLSVFGELSDSDVDWMIATGHLEEIPSGTALIQTGRPVDGLYILLDGALAVFASEVDQNPLAIAFASIEGIAASGREVARLRQGDIVGEMPFVDDRPPAITVKALEPSRVLMIPRQQLTVKLRQDVLFASHFYRVIAILLSNQLADMTSRIGYGRRVYDAGSLDETIEYDDELDLNTMDQVALAGARFDWMLKRLNVKGVR